MSIVLPVDKAEGRNRRKRRRRLSRLPSLAKALKISLWQLLTSDISSSKPDLDEIPVKSRLVVSKYSSADRRKNQDHK